jgi:hypothetical protein
MRMAELGGQRKPTMHETVEKAIEDAKEHLSAAIARYEELKALARRFPNLQLGSDTEGCTFMTPDVLSEVDSYCVVPNPFVGRAREDHTLFLVPYLEVTDPGSSTTYEIRTAPCYFKCGYIQQNRDTFDKPVFNKDLVVRELREAGVNEGLIEQVLKDERFI